MLFIQAREVNHFYIDAIFYQLRDTISHHVTSVLWICKNKKINML